MHRFTTILFLSLFLFLFYSNVLLNRDNVLNAIVQNNPLYILITISGSIYHCDKLVASSDSSNISISIDVICY